MIDYWDARDRLAEDLRLGLVAQNPAAMVDRVAACTGAGRDAAAETVERFIRDLSRELGRHRLHKNQHGPQ
jgi:hypothetical protein